MTKAYVLKHNLYLRFDVEADTVDPGYPRAIAAGWSGLDAVGFGSGIDAAVDLGTDAVYLFSGSRYVRVNQTRLAIDEGYPLDVGAQWGGMAAAGFAAGVDAAAHIGGGRVLFTQGPFFAWYDNDTDSVDGPLPLADIPGIGAFADGIDGALDWPSGMVYLFKGSQYVRFDPAAGAVDEGYPLAIADQWRGFASAGFAAGVGAGWVRRGGGSAPTPAGSADIPDDFFPALKAMCARLACAPVDLLGAMMSESGVKASAMNPSSHTARLIQIEPRQLPGLGWTEGPEAFARLSATQQLPYIERYFAPHSALGLRSAGVLYGLMFLPARVRERGTTPGTALTKAPEGFYTDNPILDADHDGQITIGDLTARIASVQTGGRWDSIVSRLNAN